MNLITSAELSEESLSPLGLGDLRGSLSVKIGVLNHHFWKELLTI